MRLEGPENVRGGIWHHRKITEPDFLFCNHYTSDILHIAMKICHYATSPRRGFNEFYTQCQHCDIELRFRFYQEGYDESGSSLYIRRYINLGELDVQDTQWHKITDLDKRRLTKLARRRIADDNSDRYNELETWLTASLSRLLVLWQRFGINIWVEKCTLHVSLNRSTQSFLSVGTKRKDREARSDLVPSLKSE